MIIGYAKTSIIEQVAGLKAQERDLKAAGAKKLFQEQISAVGERKALNDAIDFAREGDVLVVTTLDRLARSVGHLVEIVSRLKAKGVSLRILGMGIDSSTPTGKLMINLLGSIAEFEREIMLERQREGIAKAKADGKYKGRKPTARAQADVIIKLVDTGKSNVTIAKELGIGIASVYRVLKDQKQREGLPRRATRRTG
jgi:DNA invertase Pin-like site-specific DNA recombinase